MPKSKRKDKKKNPGATQRRNGQYLRPEGYSDDEVETFPVHDVDGIRTNEEGNVSLYIFIFIQPNPMFNLVPSYFTLIFSG